MSGTGLDDGSPNDVAALYVLGTLDATEAEAARARAELDRVFASEIRFWEIRLLPLTALVPPVEPPAQLWSRIEASIGAGRPAAGLPGSRITPRPANDNRQGFWRMATFAALAVAASLAITIALRPPLAPVPQPVSPAAPAFAVLAPTGTTRPVLVAFAQPGGGMLVRPSGTIPVASDRDLQLWALAAGAKIPTSLGVLPAGGKLVPPGVAVGTQLLVSLEPKGGSRTGLPTGPVLYGGLLQRMN